MQKMLIVHIMFTVKERILLMKNSDDRRVRRTKKAMTDALAHLLSQKPLKNITVREIADLADINRGTFYLHYRDVYDMAEQLQNEIFERFNEIVDNYEVSDNADVLLSLLIELFNLLADNAALSKVLIGKNGDAAFVDKLKNVIREKCFVNIKKQFKIENDAEFDYFYHYIVAGCIGIFSSWLENGMIESPTKMAELTKKLILTGAEQE